VNGVISGDFPTPRPTADLLRVLAIDTALEVCSAAVLDTERAAGTVYRSVPMLRGHAEALMPLIAAVMSTAGLEFPDLDRIAVTVGPGSFTGLRVGVAAARGIALATGKPAVGLTTLSALAAPLFEIDESKAVLAAIDARHGHVYMQVFGPGGQAVFAPRVAPLHDAMRAAAASPTRIVGNAAKLIEAVWPAGERRPLLVSAVRAPDIAWVARLGAAMEDVSGLVKPLYLREADAQPQGAAMVARQ
jgi:tRNA threonylcarbamoyladenosine biosynthesis protein TsaB